MGNKKGKDDNSNIKFKITDNTGRLPSADALARQKGFTDYDELLKYKEENPELYNAMDGVKYGPIEGSVLEKRVYELSNLQTKAKEKIIKRINNSDINELQKSIDIFDSNEWKDAETSKKHSDIINTYVDDWIALENIGYFNNLSKEDRDCAKSSLKELKQYVNYKKDWFSKYRNINDFNKDMWSNKYGAMTWDELENEEQKIRDSLLRKNTNDENYSIQEFSYVKSLRSGFDNAESYNSYVEIINMPFDELTKEFLDTRRVLKRYNDIQKSRNATYLEMYDEQYQMLDDDGYKTKEEKMEKIKDDSEGYLKQLKDAEENLNIDARFGSVDALKARYTLLEELYFRGYSNQKTADKILNAINDEKYLDFVEQGRSMIDKDDLMTDTEYDVACYYAAKEGNDNSEYLEEIQDELQRREMKEKQQSFASFADKMPILSSLISVPMNLAAAGEQVIDMGKYMVTGDVDYNYHSLGASTIRDTVASNIGDPFGSFTYNTIMSSADSFAAMGLSKLVTGNSNFGGFILGLSAAGNATNDAISRGMSDGYAFANGIAAGIFETLFESWSIGKFSKGFDDLTRIDVNNLSKFVGQNIWNNTFEEGLTEVANISYDFLVNGKYSQYETAIKNYMISGLSERNAKRKVALELADQVAQASASGALMSFGFTGAGVTKTAVTNQINENVDKAINKLQYEANLLQRDDGKIKTTPRISEDGGIRTIGSDKSFDQDAFIDGLWEGAQNSSKNNVEKSQLEKVVNHGESGIIEETKTLTLDDLTRDVLRTKPLYLPTPKKWIQNGGSITIDKQGNWIYTNSDGISVKYIDGEPDFKEAGLVIQEVDIGEFVNRYVDKKKAKELVEQNPNTEWHHPANSNKLQEINADIHKQFTHIGGIAKNRKGE